MKGLIENLTKWQNYAHYVLLTAALVVFMHYQGVHLFHTANFLPNANFVLLYVVIFVADTAIHALFWKLPKPWQWRD